MYRRGALVLAAVIIATASPARAASERARADTTAEIERRLDRKVSFEFKNTPFGKAMTHLQTLAGLTVVFGPETPKERWDSSVTLQVTDAPLRDAIDQVLVPIGLEWKVRFQALHIREKGVFEAEADDEWPKPSKELEERFVVPRVVLSSRVRAPR
jgi:hypothetical protein